MLKMSSRFDIWYIQWQNNFQNVLGGYLSGYMCTSRYESTLKQKQVYFLLLAVIELGHLAQGFHF